MDLNKYFKILEENKKIFSSNYDLKDRKISALQTIWENGYPSLIPNLIPHLKSNFAEVREMTFFIINEFLSKITSQKQLYETLRYSHFKINDFEFYKSNFTKDQYVTISGIISQNRNGFLREKAVDELAASKDCKAIKFIIFRTADWVETIRIKAKEKLRNFKQPEYIMCFVHNLYLLEWIRKIERVNLNEISKEIFCFIIDENEKFLIKNFPELSEKNRIILAKEISQSNGKSLTFNKIFVSDKNFIVRRFGLKNFELLSDSEIKKLLQDKSSKIRMQTLYEIDIRNGIDEIALNYIDDNSSSIREFARFKLKNKNIDFARIYAENLIKNKNIVGSLFGLAEVDSQEYSDLMIPFLTNDNNSFVKAAFLALQKIEPKVAFNFALKNLETKQISVRNMIIKYFEKNYNDIVLIKARSLYKTGDFELRKAMLKLFNSIGKYTTISDLMIGTIDENSVLRNLSADYIKIWKHKVNFYSLEPKPIDIQRAKEIYKIVNEILINKKYFYQNPIKDLYFYFK